MSSNNLHFVPIYLAPHEWRPNKPIDWSRQIYPDCMWTHRPFQLPKSFCICLSTNAWSPESIPDRHCLWAAPYLFRQCPTITSMPTPKRYNTIYLFILVRCGWQRFHFSFLILDQSIWMAHIATVRIYWRTYEEEIKNDKMTTNRCAKLQTHSTN